MRLKTKLIPLTSLGLATLTIAPISLTSCSKGLIGKSFDLVKNYYPETPRHEYAELQLHDIHNLYCEQILAHPETFVEDYFWSKSWRGTSFDQYVFWQELFIDQTPLALNATKNKWCFGAAKDMYERDNEVISNLKISTQTLTKNSVEWIIPTLSFTLEFNSKVNSIILDQWFAQDNVSGYISGEVNGKIEFYNVPFSIQKVTFDSQMIDGDYIQFDVICLDPDFEWMKGESGALNPRTPNFWKINTEVVSTIFGEIKYNTGVHERIADDWTFSMEANSSQPEWRYGHINIYDTIINGFTSSYYLNNIKLVEKNGGNHE